MHRYASPEAFRQALEMRLRSSAGGGASFIRRRQFLIFDRLLARLGRIRKDAVVLKGGVALELRLTRARATKDVDLRYFGPQESLLEDFLRAARLDLGDWMNFEIIRDPEWLEPADENARFEGLRLCAECRIAGRLIGQRFGVDVAFDDPLFGAPMRKDLPDLALLATIQSLEATRLRSTVQLCFQARDTHAVPSTLPKPPGAWSVPYAQMAREDRLQWRDLESVYAAARALLDPLLTGAAVEAWSPSAQCWLS